MKDICWSVFLLVLYYWWVKGKCRSLSLYEISAQLNTNKDQILKSNLAAGELLDHLGTPRILRYFLLEDHSAGKGPGTA